MLTRVAKLSRLIIEAIRALSEIPEFFYEGIAFRGVLIAGDQPYHRELQRKFHRHHEYFIIGELLTFAPFTSLTLSEEVAEEFGDTIFFVFLNARGVKIQKLSAIPRENEILLEAPSVFRIIACAKFRGILQVTLERVEAPITYLSRSSSSSTSSLSSSSTVSSSLSSSSPLDVLKNPDFSLSNLSR